MRKPEFSFHLNKIGAFTVDNTFSPLPHYSPWAAKNKKGTSAPESPERSKMYVKNEEQETIIRFGREGQTAFVCTSDVMVMNKLDKLVDSSYDWKFLRETKFRDGNIAEKEYECPKRFISFRSKKTSRVLTEEQKKASAERMRLLNLAKSKN